MVTRHQSAAAAVSRLAKKRRLASLFGTIFQNPSDSGRARPSQAEGQGKAETLRLSPRFQAELIVLYILGRAEGRRFKVRGPNDLSIHCFLIFLRR